jgi:hypothetical protein
LLLVEPLVDLVAVVVMVVVVELVETSLSKPACRNQLVETSLA